MQPHKMKNVAVKFLEEARSTMTNRERFRAVASFQPFNRLPVMAGKQGSMISPAMVREFMMPCYLALRLTVSGTFLSGTFSSF